MVSSFSFFSFIRFFLNSAVTVRRAIKKTETPKKSDTHTQKNDCGVRQRTAERLCRRSAREETTTGGGGAGGGAGAEGQGVDDDTIARMHCCCCPR